MCECVVWHVVNALMPRLMLRGATRCGAAASQDAAKHHVMKQACLNLISIVGPLFHCGTATNDSGDSDAFGAPVAFRKQGYV